MADFDGAWPKRFDREAVESAVALDSMEKGHNVVLVAPQGLSFLLTSARPASPTHTPGGNT